MPLEIESGATCPGGAVDGSRIPVVSFRFPSLALADGGKVVNHYYWLLISTFQDGLEV